MSNYVIPPSDSDGKYVELVCKIPIAKQPMEKENPHLIKIGAEKIDAELFSSLED